MRYGSVCAGIEAATVAWHPLGWEPGFFSEIDPFPRAVLNHHYPEIPLHGDFTTIGADQYGPIQLLVGGTPCQSFSVAGLRKGLADDRGNLALEYLRLADRKRPRWLVWENVPGVLSSSEGRDFGAFLGGLVELGYGFAYRVLDAQYFGVPQRRRRVFVVGYLGDWRPPAAVLFERDCLRRNPPPRREAGSGTAVFTPGSFGSYREQVGTLRANGGDFGPGTENLAVTEPETAHTLRSRHDSSEDGTGRGTPMVWPAEITTTLDASFAKNMGQDNQHIDSNATLFVPETVGALTAKGPQGLGAPEVDARHYISFQSNGNTDDIHAAGDNVSPTVRGAGSGAPPAVTQPVMTKQGAGNQGGDYMVNGLGVRRLTPVECERLQGFPDDYTLVPYRKGTSADGPRYKALGNSMAVPVMRWIGERIKEVDSILAENKATEIISEMNA